MAHETSALWKQLFEMRGTRREHKFIINGVEYDESSEMGHSVTGGLFDEFSIGNTKSSVLRLEIYAEEVPRAAKIQRYVRLINRDVASEWIPKGVFYCNNRAVDDGLWQIEAFDAMKKADVPFIATSDVGQWPRMATDVVNEIAERMGVDIDARTVIDSTMQVPYTNDMTMREVLANIAAAHIGNWVMSDSGELWLVPLLSAPSETNFLVTERGSVITIGGVRLLV